MFALFTVRLGETSAASEPTSVGTTKPLSTKLNHHSPSTSSLDPPSVSITLLIKSRIILLLWNELRISTNISGRTGAEMRAVMGPGHQTSLGSAEREKEVAAVAEVLTTSKEGRECR